jgi:hypothetical protein
MMFLSESDIRRRKRMNFMTKHLGRAWIPLSIIYVAWLAIIGHEAARSYGIVACIIIGLGYPMIIGVSLAARSTKPIRTTNPTPEEERDRHDDEEEREARYQAKVDAWRAANMGGGVRPGVPAVDDRKHTRPPGGN